MDVLAMASVRRGDVIVIQDLGLRTVPTAFVQFSVQVVVNISTVNVLVIQDGREKNVNYVMMNVELPIAMDMENASMENALAVEATKENSALKWTVLIPRAMAMDSVLLELACAKKDGEVSTVSNQTTKPCSVCLTVRITASLTLILKHVHVNRGGLERIVPKNCVTLTVGRTEFALDEAVSALTSGQERSVISACVTRDAVIMANAKMAPAFASLVGMESTVHWKGVPTVVVAMAVARRMSKASGNVNVTMDGQVLSVPSAWSKIATMEKTMTKMD